MNRPLGFPPRRSERLPPGVGRELVGGLILSTTPTWETCFSELPRAGREQLLIPGVQPLAVLPPKVAIVGARTIDPAVSTAAAERTTREQLLFDFLAPARRPVVRECGGPDPSKPCEGCAKRARCRAPCELLSKLLAPEEITASNEISSPALMAGRGYDPQFMTMPEVLLADAAEDEVELWPVIAAQYGPMLREHLPALTPAQREVLGLYLDGKDRTEIGRIRDTKRQVTHKILWAGLRTLQEILGPLPGGLRGRPRRGDDEGDG